MEKLTNKTVKELRAIAGAMGVVGRWSMNKTELISAISNSETPETTNKGEGILIDVAVGTKVKTKSVTSKKAKKHSPFIKTPKAKEGQQIAETVNVTISSSDSDYTSIVGEIVGKGREIHENMVNSRKNQFSKNDLGTKRNSMDYLKNKEIGLIVAIEHEGKFYSAKIIGYPNSNQIQIETRHNSIFVVDNSQVKWVRTGHRWPKFVFEKFKESKAN